MEIRTKRLLLREINDDDFDNISVSLKDIDVMYAWEHAFSDEEIKAWISRRKNGYDKQGYDYFLAYDIERNVSIGQLGLLNESIGDSNYIGLGWILNRNEWGKGYATEGARALLEYAFITIGATEVIAKIRCENTSSILVANRIGMTEAGETNVFYLDKVMPHKIFILKKAEYLSINNFN